MYRKGLLVAAACALLAAAPAMAQDMNQNGGRMSAWHKVAMRDPATIKKMCVEHFARSSGRLAYLEAKLQLTSDQQSLWDKWADETTKGNVQMRDDCLAAVPTSETPRTALDRDTQIEKMLSDKLDTMKAARPALDALYQSLSPEQRVAFDRGLAPRWMGHHRWQRQDERGEREMSPT
jgi:hypothetical protein